MASFLRFAYVPAPFAIYRDVHKVLPGEVVSIGPGGRKRRRKYWDLGAVAAAGLANQFTGSDADAEASLSALLADAVSAQMSSDVPLGAFLSGGIDSSTVVALMVAARRGPVRTFSIGFPDFGYDESIYARAVAHHLGTMHEELTVTAADALSVVHVEPRRWDAGLGRRRQADGQRARLGAGRSLRGTGSADRQLHGRNDAGE